MWKVFKYLLVTANVLFWGVVAVLYQTSLRGDSVKGLPAWLSFISAHKWTLGAGIVVFSVSPLYAHHRDRLHAIQDKVFLYKSVRVLRPSDIVPAEAWYQAYFFPRAAVDRAAELLASNRGVLMLGIPPS